MEEMENKEIAAWAIKQALKVDFLTDNEEVKLYAKSLYNARMWGGYIDKNNRRIRKRKQLKNFMQ